MIFKSECKRRRQRCLDVTKIKKTLRRNIKNSYCKMYMLSYLPCDTSEKLYMKQCILNELAIEDEMCFMKM